MEICKLKTIKNCLFWKDNSGNFEAADRLALHPEHVPESMIPSAISQWLYNTANYTFSALWTTFTSFAHFFTSPYTRSSLFPMLSITSLRHPKRVLAFRGQQSGEKVPHCAIHWRVVFWSCPFYIPPLSTARVTASSTKPFYLFNPYGTRMFGQILVVVKFSTRLALRCFSSRPLHAHGCTPTSATFNSSL